MSFRAGTGFDLHRLVPGRPLVLCGVRFASPVGLLGHSDADAPAHAVIDAMLGAAALGDIGAMFPDTDPRWEGADSMALLRAAAGRVRAAGWGVGNIDVTIVAETPKIAPAAAQMRANLAAAAGVPVSAVSVKGKTAEGLGHIGAGEAIAAHAAVSLFRDAAGDSSGKDV